MRAHEEGEIGGDSFGYGMLSNQPLSGHLTSSHKPLDKRCG